MENTDIKYYDIEELGTWPIASNTLQVTEGKLHLSQHLTRERNSKIVKLAKERFKDRHCGKIYCELCTFDFSEAYGEIGADFIEAHHKKPISKMLPGEITAIDDFIMVCSNCHSMLHIGKEWITPEKLREILQHRK